MRNVGLAALAAAFVAGSTGTAAVAEPPEGTPDNSAAEIAVNDCVLESSKEISYIGYFADGELLSRDDDIDATTVDLAELAGIDAVDSVTVKSGTTVASFPVDCGETADGPGDGDGDGDGGDGDGGDSSEATITLTGCLLVSSKEISYIEYYTGGSLVSRDEDVDESSVDLSTVDGIGAIDTISVKSGTTVERFPVDCAPADGGDDGDEG